MEKRRVYKFTLEEIYDILIDLINEDTRVNENGVEVPPIRQDNQYGVRIIIFYPEKYAEFYLGDEYEPITVQFEIPDPCGNSIYYGDPETE